MENGLAPFACKRLSGENHLRASQLKSGCHYCSARGCTCDEEFHGRSKTRKVVLGCVKQPCRSVDALCPQIERLLQDGSALGVVGARAACKARSWTEAANAAELMCIVQAAACGSGPTQH